MGPGEIIQKDLFSCVLWAWAGECLSVCLLKGMPTVVSLW
jgi:hypothetical protein